MDRFLCEFQQRTGGFNTLFRLQNQSINQSINQSVNQSLSQSINHLQFAIASRFTPTQACCTICTKCPMTPGFYIRDNQLQYSQSTEGKISSTKVILKADYKNMLLSSLSYAVDSVQSLSSGIRNGVKGCKTSFKLVHDV